MPRTLVPALMSAPPLTFRPLTMVTESPSTSSLPTESRTLEPAASSVSPAAVRSHSWPHMGHAQSSPIS